MGKKDWFFSGKVFTSLILIFFPMLYAFFFILSSPTLSSFDWQLEQFLYPIVISDQPISNQSSYPPLVFPPIPLLIVLLVFALYPASFSTPRFFEKRGFENVVIEYQYMKTILFISIILLITFLPLFLIIEYFRPIINDIENDKTIKDLQQKIETKLDSTNITVKLDKELQKELKTWQKNDNNINKTKELRSLVQELNSSIYSIDNNIGIIEVFKPEIQKFHSLLSFGTLTNILYFSLFFILPIPFFIIIKLLLEHSRKLLKLYLAKGCFKIVLEETSDEIDKARYFMRGLIWYNKFLNKTISLHINNVDYICEKVFKSPLYNNIILLSIAKSFCSKDGFKPLRRILTIFANTQEEKILTKGSLRTQIQESSDLIIPIITTLILIITTFFLQKPGS